MRHELKYVISPMQYLLLRGRLGPFMSLDEYATDSGDYFIRSVYFDSFKLDAYEEKNAGILQRKKYRIRYYNGNVQHCRLECKIKRGTRIDKKSCKIPVEQVRDLLTGNVCYDNLEGNTLLDELKLKIRNEGFKPQVVVDYLREAYVYPLSNLRITFDKEVGAGKVENCLDTERNLSNILQEGYMILEVKYDDVIPEHISDMIASIRPVQVAASKYSMCMTAKLEGRIL